MIKMKVRFYSIFRDLFGDSSKVVRLPDGSTIEELLGFLCDSEQRIREIYDDSGELGSYVFITLNRGNGVQLIQEPDVTLENGDVVSIFPPIGGG